MGVPKDSSRVETVDKFVVEFSDLWDPNNIRVGPTGSVQCCPQFVFLPPYPQQLKQERSR